MGVQTFDSSGTWMAPAGVTSVVAKAWGGGGGGCKATTQSQTGGGGGEYAQATLAVTPGNTYTVTVGPAGANGQPGSNGGDTTFTGDSGPVIARGGKAGPLVGTSPGGAGGTGGTGTVLHDGGQGGGGGGFSGGAGGGGGAGGDSGTGGAGGNGAGGSAGAGGTGNDGGGNGGNGSNNSGIQGSPGVVPGGGGGGGCTTNGLGGDGAHGRVILEWSDELDVPFIASNTVVNSPTLIGSGNIVSQDAIEGLLEDADAAHRVSQDALEAVEEVGAAEHRVSQDAEEVLEEVGGAANRVTQDAVEVVYLGSSGAVAGTKATNLYRGHFHGETGMNRTMVLSTTFGTATVQASAGNRVSQTVVEILVALPYP